MWTLFASFFLFIKDIVSWFVKKTISLGVKYPILLAYIASVFALSSIFYVAIDALLLSLRLVFPTEYLQLVASFIPQNSKFCFSVVLSCRLILLSFHWSLKFRDKAYKIAVDSADLK